MSDAFSNLTHVGSAWMSSWKQSVLPSHSTNTPSGTSPAKKYFFCSAHAPHVDLPNMRTLAARKQRRSSGVLASASSAPPAPPGRRSSALNSATGSANANSASTASMWKRSKSSHGLAHARTRTAEYVDTSNTACTSVHHGHSAPMTSSAATRYTTKPTPAACSSASGAPSSGFSVAAYCAAATSVTTLYAMPSTDTGTLSTYAHSLSSTLEHDTCALKSHARPSAGAAHTKWSAVM
mmetsp:Transcript_44702/g.109708  ORF Transcript_44702/g.109708 Transcript_44702/m.109708 type:complete len:237 (-) Transcript_44702:64-774(-)